MLPINPLESPLFQKQTKKNNPTFVRPLPKLPTKATRNSPTFVRPLPKLPTEATSEAGSPQFKATKANEKGFVSKAANSVLNLFLRFAKTLYFSKNTAHNFIARIIEGTPAPYPRDDIA